jgi:hypothetical protein
VVMGHLDEAHKGRSVRPDRGKVLVVIVQFSGACAAGSRTAGNDRPKT